MSQKNVWLFHSYHSISYRISTISTKNSAKTICEDIFGLAQWIWNQMEFLHRKISSDFSKNPLTLWTIKFLVKKPSEKGTTQINLQLFTCAIVQLAITSLPACTTESQIFYYSWPRLKMSPSIFISKIPHIFDKFIKWVSFPNDRKSKLSNFCM